MKIPKKLSRKTKHARPRCQLYQPGFNDFNSCWLEGSWVTVPSEGFEDAAKAHEALYKGIRKEAKKQHHRGKPTPEADMTPAQRQAWLHFSGEGILDARHEPSGHIGPVGVTLAGNKLDEKSIRWMRKHGYKVLPKVTNGKTVTDQTGLVPPDLLAPDKEPINTWQNIVKQNRDRAEEMSRALAEDPGPMGDFGIQMACHGLVELEESIVRNTLGKTRDHLETPEEVIDRYKALRADLEKSLGDKFQSAYAGARNSHNECARINLERSKGRLYCFVLPEFQPDGSHAQIGPTDFPYAYPEEYALPCTSS